MGLLSKESLIIGAVLAIIALVMTFIGGLVGGLSFGKIIVNSFLFTLLLGVVGVIAAAVLEKLIPGIWSSDSDEQVGEDSPLQDKSQGSVDFTVGDDVEESKSYFSEMESDLGSEGDSDVSAYNENENENMVSVSDDSGLTSTTVSNGYREINGKKFVDDPEEYAKAIKTMLLKDD